MLNTIIECPGEHEYVFERNNQITNSYNEIQKGMSYQYNVILLMPYTQERINISSFGTIYKPIKSYVDLMLPQSIYLSGVVKQYIFSIDCAIHGYLV